MKENSEVQECNEKHCDEKDGEKEKSLGVPVSAQSVGVWLNVMLRAHPEIGRLKE